MKPEAAKRLKELIAGEYNKVRPEPGSDNCRLLPSHPSDMNMKGGKIPETNCTLLPSSKPYAHRNIGPDSPILNGIYVTAHWETIIVDLNYKPSEILRLYDIAKKKVVQNATANKKMTEGLVMRAIYETVGKEMRSENGQKMADAIIEANRVNDGEPIWLDRFIKNKAGKARHFTLACAALFELFKENWKGTKMGTVSVEENEHESAYLSCRYTNTEGKVFVLDVAENVLLPLEQAALKFDKNEIQWDYRRPTDRV